MKSYYLFFLTILLALSTQAQDTLKVSMGLNTATVGQGGGSIQGLQLGVGTELPLPKSFYFSPSLWLTQGGQSTRNGDFRFGIRNTYVQLSAAAGYEYVFDT